LAGAYSGPGGEATARAETLPKQALVESSFFALTIGRLHVKNKYLAL
jgi:hypothetical protein